MSTVKERLETIEQRVKEACERSGRSRDEVTIVAVTKSVSVERTKEVIDASCFHLAENRPNGFRNKVEALGTDERLTWHYIGNIQSRQVKQFIDEVDVIHSLSKESVAKQIDKRADRVVDCFVQMNVSGEASKSGLTEDEVVPFIEMLEQYSNIRVIGLMTMAPYDASEEDIRNVFVRLREQRDRIQGKQFEHAPCTQLSMGMSNDFEIAIEEGATHIRIGTALVGKESEEMK